MKTINTAAVALAFTATEELATAQAVVAWTGAAMDMVLGWTGAAKVGRPVAVKTLREKYGYHLQADGSPKLDAKGNRMKRSAIFDRIATVDSLLDHIVKRDKAWIATFQEAVQGGNADAYDSAIKALAAQIVSSAEGRGLKEIRFWLDNQRPMPKGPTKDSADELAGEEKPKAAAKGQDPARKPDIDPEQITLAHVQRFISENIEDDKIMTVKVIEAMGAMLQAELDRRQAIELPKVT